MPQQSLRATPHVAQRGAASHQHDDSIEPERDAPMGWGSVAQRLEEEAPLEEGVRRRGLQEQYGQVAQGLVHWNSNGADGKDLY